MTSADGEFSMNVRGRIQLRDTLFGEGIETESKLWMAACNTCGTERSIWSIGGVRWKAAGAPTRIVPCPTCGKSRAHRVYFKETT